MLHGVVAWVVAWLLHGCCMVVAWKNSTPVRRVSSEPSYAVVPGLVGGPWEQWSNLLFSKALLDVFSNATKIGHDANLNLIQIW